jgi:sugar/nucleoside kinase (ribokinase family)
VSAVRPVVVVGDVGLDVIVRPQGTIQHGTDTRSDVTITPGGAGANTAAWLAAYGMDVTLLARIGDDHAGQTVRRDLEACGVTPVLVVDATHPTCTVVVLVDSDGERTMFPDRGANRQLTDGDVDLAQLRLGGEHAAVPHLHVSAYVLFDEGSRAAGLAALRHARSLGWTTSVDPQSPAHLRAVGPERFLDWIDGIDLLLPNDAELTTLGGDERALRAVRAVVVTEDARGARWVCRAADGSLDTVRVEAPSVEVVDPTGAGDAFNAGFLGAWLGGADPDVALRAGVEAGSAAVTRTGARPGVTSGQPGDQNASVGT